MSHMTFEKAKIESRRTGRTIMFQQGTTTGFMRFHQSEGNWYWIDVRTVRRRSASSKNKEEKHAE